MAKKNFEYIRSKNGSQIIGAKVYNQKENSPESLVKILEYNLVVKSKKFFLLKLIDFVRKVSLEAVIL